MENNLIWQNLKTDLFADFGQKPLSCVCRKIQRLQVAFWVKVELGNCRKNKTNSSKNVWHVLKRFLLVQTNKNGKCNLLELFQKKNSFFAFLIKKFCMVFSELKTASPKEHLGESKWLKLLIFWKTFSEKEPNCLRQSSQNLFLMFAAKPRWIWFLTENCKSKCSLGFYAKQFRLVFPKLRYTFSDEQYCELKHFEKLSWNANFFQILNLNLLAENLYLEKKYIIIFFQFFSKDLLVDVVKVLSYFTVVLPGENGEKFKKSYWFWMSTIFFPCFSQNWLLHVGLTFQEFSLIWSTLYTMILWDSNYLFSTGNFKNCFYGIRWKLAENKTCRKF